MSVSSQKTNTWPWVIVPQSQLKVKLASEQLSSDNAPIEYNAKNKGIICTGGHLVGPVKRDQGVVGMWPRCPLEVFLRRFVH